MNRTMGAIALAVGVGSMFAPRSLVRLYGMDPDEMTEVAKLGWRLFAARNLVVGAATFRGVPLAGQLTVAVQVPDQLVFLHAYRTGSVPRPAAAAAMATSAVIVAAGLAGR